MTEIVIVRTCTVDHCRRVFEGNPATAEGWCHVCYTRWWRRGKDPDRVVPPPLPHRRLVAYDDFIQVVTRYPRGTDQWVADWLGVCRRTVIRYRQRLAREEER